MGRIEKLLAQRQLEVVQKVTLDVHRALVMASPVDSGKFRAAWTVETPSKPGGSGKIENNTEYAVPLANGHSQQAPAGWIENQIEAVIQIGGRDA